MPLAMIVRCHEKIWFKEDRRMYSKEWYDILEKAHRNERFYNLSRSEVDGFRTTMDHLYLEFTKEQVLKFISDLYDNADAALVNPPNKE